MVRERQEQQAILGGIGPVEVRCRGLEDLVRLQLRLPQIREARRERGEDHIVGGRVGGEVPRLREDGFADRRVSGRLARIFYVIGDHGSRSMSRSGAG